MWPRKNKYNAKRKNGFHSTAESDLYDYLKLMESQGVIKDIVKQKTVSLTESDIRSKIDFLVTECETEFPYYCEMKGFEGERWIIIRKLWGHYGPAPLKVYRKSHRGIYLSETIIPKNVIRPIVKKNMQW